MLRIRITLMQIWICIQVISLMQIKIQLITFMPIRILQYSRKSSFVFGFAFAEIFLFEKAWFSSLKFWKSKLNYKILYRDLPTHHDSPTQLVGESMTYRVPNSTSQRVFKKVFRHPLPESPSWGVTDSLTQWLGESGDWRLPVSTNAPLTLTSLG